MATKWDRIWRPALVAFERGERVQALFALVGPLQ
jgi:hypothetical protein